MSNFDKIDAYLENAMTAAEKQQFEQALSSDPELKRELTFQQDIVEGLKEARKLELKAMLDKVPVGGSGMGDMISLTKLVSGVAIVGVVAYGVYTFTQREPEPVSSPSTEEVIVEQPQESLLPETDIPVAEERVKEEQEELVAENKEVFSKKNRKEDQIDSEESSNEPVVSKEIEIKKPTVAPLFETEETDSLEAPTNKIVSKVEGNISSMDIEVDNTKKKFSFHYQFNQGKLFLYGDFDKDLYEILEFKTTANKMLFLYYKDAFYPLDKQQVKITELKPVTDKSLIKKLEKAADINQE